MIRDLRCLSNSITCMYEHKVGSRCPYWRNGGLRSECTIVKIDRSIYKLYGCILLSELSYKELTKEKNKMSIYTDLTEPALNYFILQMNKVSSNNKIKSQLVELLSMFTDKEMDSIQLIENLRYLIPARFKKLNNAITELEKNLQTNEESLEQEESTTDGLQEDITVVDGFIDLDLAITQMDQDKLLRIKHQAEKALVKRANKRSTEPKQLRLNLDESLSLSYAVVRKEFNEYMAKGNIDGFKLILRSGSDEDVKKYHKLLKRIPFSIADNIKQLEFFNSGMMGMSKRVQKKINQTVLFLNNEFNYIPSIDSKGKDRWDNLENGLKSMLFGFLASSKLFHPNRELYKQIDDTKILSNSLLNEVKSEVIRIKEAKNNISDYKDKDKPHDGSIDYNTTMSIRVKAINEFIEKHTITYRKYFRTAFSDLNKFFLLRKKFVYHQSENPDGIIHLDGQKAFKTFYLTMIRSLKTANQFYNEYWIGMINSDTNRELKLKAIALKEYMG